jgi:hypothetical protein
MKEWYESNYEINMGVPWFIVVIVVAGFVYNLFLR